MNDGTAIFRAKFQWQPTLTDHEDTGIITLLDAPAPPSGAKPWLYRSHTTTLGVGVGRAT